MEPDYCRSVVGNAGTRRRLVCKEDTVNTSVDPVVLATTTIEVVERARQIRREREAGRPRFVTAAEEVDRLVSLSDARTQHTSDCEVSRIAAHLFTNPKDI